MIQVYDRVSTFLDSLWRSFDVSTCRNYVLVTHGISIRVILARYYRYSIDQFHLLANPKNCECIELRHDGKGKLILAGRHELEVADNDNSTSPPTLQYRHHERLRVIPQRQVRPSPVRLFYGEDDAAAVPSSVAGTCP